ncbi:MAG: CPBP family intramembrane metalloprotease [Candidatus Alcyoniella australis]|nr:CPBP family intramembrane metalloprotease [Candidatus Alcyoniella australis]
MFKAIKSELIRVFRELRQPEALVLLISSVLILVHHSFFRRGSIRRNILPQFGIKPIKGEFSELYPYAIWALSSFVIYFVIPLLLIKLLHRRKLSDFGLGIGDSRLALKIVGLFALIMLPLTVLVGLLPDLCNFAGWQSGAEALDAFVDYYPQVKWVDPLLIGKTPVSAGTMVGRLLLVHLFLFLYFIGWEFLFRGYMLFGLYDRLGFNAVLIANLPFVVLHYSKPFPEALGSVIAGIALCVLALKTRSFWPCVILHWMVAASMEWVVVLRSLV